MAISVDVCLHIIMCAGYTPRLRTHRGRRAATRNLYVQRGAISLKLGCLDEIQAMSEEELTTLLFAKVSQTAGAVR